MTTITDTSILNWLPFDDTGGELWRLALVNSENQNWNATDPNNSTTTLAMTAASRHGGGSSLLASPAHLGLATGLLLSLLINSRIWTAKANKEVFGSKLPFGTPKPYQWILHLTPSSSFTFASTKTFILPYLYLLPLLAIILLLPILSALITFLLPFAIYRLAVQMYLNYRSDTQIRKKLFSGADAVWTFNESYESYSVINALVVLEGEPQIDKLRDILTTRLGSIPKLRMRHNFTLGYATWYEDMELDIGSLVQWVPGFWGNAHSNTSEEETQETKTVDYECLSHTKWNRQNLSKIVESLCNRPLPENHTVGWEALVGKAMAWDESDDEGLNIDNAMSKNNNQHMNDEAIIHTVFPILFRIHHSVGDGSSLLQLLMSALIDDDSTNSKNNEHKTSLTSLSRPLTLNINPTVEDQNERKMPNKAFMHASPEQPKLSSNSKTHDFKTGNSSTGLKGVCHQMEHFTEVNSVAENMRSNSQFQNPPAKSETVYAKDKESSFLYGRRLSGNKTILWDSTSVTVEEIKKIRGATGVKFTEILLSAVSAALSNYWDAREKGWLNDETSVNKKYMGRKKAGDKTCKTSCQGKESEYDWDQLEDVPEENEEEYPKKEYALQMGCDKQESPPPSVKLVLPAILGSLFQKKNDLTLKDTSHLENLFSVAVMTLPVGKSGGCPLERLSKVSDASGYMMPLRKDSIVECGKRVKFEKEALISHVTDAVQGMKKAAPTTYQELGNVSSSTKAIPPGTTPRENIHEHSTNKEHLKRASIKPGEPDILTYYYTKKPEVQVKLTQGTDSMLNRSAQVQYHRYSDSAKVILLEKEPYHCPTTIFFTQNIQRNISCDSTKKSNSNVYNACTDSSNKTTNETYDLNCPSVKYPEVLTLKKTDIQTVEKEESTTTTLVPAKNQVVSASKSIQFPSSPTIQHLLTRWLALDIVATVLPSVLAAPMMKVAAKGVAVVMSNLPGPPKRLHSILGGHALKDIVFWAPHRGYTGLGITILSYDGMLHIGLMADDAVIPTQKGAQFIMNTVMDELHSLGAAVSSSR